MQAILLSSEEVAQPANQLYSARFGALLLKSRLRLQAKFFARVKVQKLAVSSIYDSEIRKKVQVEPQQCFLFFVFCIFSTFCPV